MSIFYQVIEPDLDAAPVQVGDGAIRMRNHILVSGQVPSPPFWVQLDSDDNKVFQVTSLPHPIRTPHGTIAILSSDPRTPSDTYALESTNTDGEGQVAFPRMLSSGGAWDQPTAINVGAGDFTLELFIQLHVDEHSILISGIADVRESHIALDMDIWGRAEGFVPLGLAIDGSGNLVLGSGFAAQSWATTWGTTNVGDGLKHHVAFQRRQSDGLVEVFIDGALEYNFTGPTSDLSYPTGVDPSTLDPNQNNSEDIVLFTEKHAIGTDAGLRGKISSFRVSDARRYPTGGFTPPADPMPNDASAVGVWEMNDGSGATVAAVTGPAGAIESGTNGPQWTTADVLLAASSWMSGTGSETYQFPPTGVVSDGGFFDDIGPHQVEAVIVASGGVHGDAPGGLNVMSCDRVCDTLCELQPGWNAGESQGSTPWDYVMQMFYRAETTNLQQFDHGQQSARFYFRCGWAIRMQGGWNFDVHNEPNSFAGGCDPTDTLPHVGFECPITLSAGVWYRIELLVKYIDDQDFRFWIRLYAVDAGTVLTTAEGALLVDWDEFDVRFDANPPAGYSIGNNGPVVEQFYNDGNVLRYLQYGDPQGQGVDPTHGHQIMWGGNGQAGRTSLANAYGINCVRVIRADGVGGSRDIQPADTRWAGHLGQMPWRGRYRQAGGFTAEPV